MHRRKFLQTGSLIPFIGGSLFKPGPVEAGVRPRHYQLPDTGTRDFFYRPQDAWAADFIPLYANGEFQLFYLLDWRDPSKKGEGTPWYRISTNDFVNFKEHGEMLKRGSVEEQDLYVFTGSAIQVKDKYHIFYTGHNPHLREKGKPEQGVMHAVSDDMQNWVKIPEHTFFAPGDKYEKNDWRDPFVFWNAEDNEYNMLLAARHKTGIPRRRGLTALCNSKDLVSWTVKEPFYAPDLYFTHECPDLFKMGDWWYLLFSEFTDKVRTRYRMSRSIKGPWLTPARDDFDGHAFYAAKTASDGKQRFLFGWNPTRSDNKDNGNWQWGGNLVVHEIIQQKNGELCVDIPSTVSKAFNRENEVVFKDGAGKFTDTKNKLELNAAGTFSAASAGPLPGLCSIKTSVQFDNPNGSFGLMFRTSDDFEKSYYIRFEPSQNKVVFDKWPRDRSEVDQMVELERPLQLNPGKPVVMEAIIEGSKGVAYINRQVAMNFRAYDLPAGNWGFFATGCKASFTGTQLLTR